jgi:hypothetical protein
MSDWVNHGISAQNVTAHNIAIGNNNRIEESSRFDQLAQPLAELKGAIDAYQGPPETQAALVAAHAEIAHELSTEAADKNKLITKLMSLSGLAGPATNIIQAAAALTQVITAIL